MRIRSSDPKFLGYVREYYKILMEQVVPLQITNGGPIIMMQIENEYGSYGEDKDYLRAIKTLMEDLGVNVPLFTSDGSWLATLAAGSMVEEGVFHNLLLGLPLTLFYQTHLLLLYLLYLLVFPP